MLKELANVARAARETAGLSQIDIASSAQVTAATISRFENGKRRPRNLEKIIKAYAVECEVDEAWLWQQATEQLG